MDPYSRIDSLEAARQTEPDDPYAYPRFGGQDALERRWLHKALMVLDAPTGWPAWLVGAVAVVLVAGAALPWRMVGGEAWHIRAAALLIALGAFDWLVLLSLPRLRLSFGPVEPQFFLLLFARMGLACAAGLLAFLLPTTAVFWGMTALEVLAAGALAWGTWAEPARVRLTHYSLSVEGLETQWRVLHISDLHVERIGRREEGLLALTEKLAPDLILLTGDYLNLSCVDDVAAHAEARRLLANLRAPAGVYAVLGSPPVDRNSASLFEGLPIQLLRNRVHILNGIGERPIALIGMDCSHDIERDGRVLRRLWARVPRDAFTVLLYHSPDLMPAAAELGIDLYLCGHTHGGQVRLPFYGALITSSRYGKRYEMGCYREGRTHLYVSRGVGLEGLAAPRVRFLCPPEVTLFTLRPAESQWSSDPISTVWTPSKTNLTPAQNNAILFSAACDLRTPMNSSDAGVKEIR